MESSEVQDQILIVCTTALSPRSRGVSVGVTACSSPSFSLGRCVEGNCAILTGHFYLLYKIYDRLLCFVCHVSISSFLWPLMPTLKN